jgi:hypothetical protein
LVTTKELLPGGEGEVKVTVQTKGRSGNLTKTATVQTDDPNAPVISLTLSGKVTMDIEVVPRFITFGRVMAPYKDITREVTLKLRPDSKTQIKGFKTQHDLFTVQKVPEKSVDNQIALLVTPKAELPPGQQRDILVVETSNEKNPNIQIQIHMIVTGNITIQPESLYFSAQRKEQSITVFKSDPKAGKNFKILRVETSTPKLKAQITEVEKESRFEIKITYLPGDQPEPLQGTITVKTNDEKQKEIIVKVVGK